MDRKNRYSIMLARNVIDFNSILLRRNNLNTDTLKNSTGSLANDPRAVLFREIKKGLQRKRKTSQKELIIQTTKIQNEEKNLTTIAKKFKKTWVMIQSRSTFLSLLRKSLHNTRNFGISYRKLRSSHTIDLDQEKKAKKWYIIYPDDLTNKIHITIMMILMIYLLVFFPLELAFDYDEKYPGFKYISYVIYSYFFIDIIFSFIMAYEFAGRMVDDCKMISINYMTGWFLIDIIATVPLDLIPGVGNFKFKTLLKLPRVLRIINSVFQNSSNKQNSFSYLAQKLKQIFSSAKSVFVIKSVILTASFVHIVACVWIFLISLDEFNWFYK